MGLSKAEAVRTLVEAQLDGQKVRDRNQASFERLIQINEYMFLRRPLPLTNTSCPTKLASR